MMTRRPKSTSGKAFAVSITYPKAQEFDAGLNREKRVGVFLGQGRGKGCRSVGTPDGGTEARYRDQRGFEIAKSSPMEAGDRGFPDLQRTAWGSDNCINSLRAGLHTRARKPVA